MNVEQELYREQMQLLCENFGVPDGEGRQLRMDAYAVVVGQDWVTEDVFAAAVDDCLKYCAPPMPPTSEFRQMLDNARREIAFERQAKDAVIAALPRPADVDVTKPPKRFALEKWDRNVAIGKARQRKRNERIKAWRKENPQGWPPKWPQGDFQPSEGEIDAVLREMASTGQLKGGLDAALSIRVPIDIGVGNNWP